MKKNILIVLFFCFGTIFMLVGLFYPWFEDLSKQVFTPGHEPESLSEINIRDYVSLPVMETLVIENEKPEDTGMTSAEAQKKALDWLQGMATELKTVTDSCSMIVDYQIMDGEVELETDNEATWGMDDKTLPDEIKQGLSEASVGDKLKIRDISQFGDYMDVSANITIRKIYDMQYPVTDDYIKKYTEFATFSELVSSIEKEVQSKADNEEELMKSRALSEAIKQTTFLDLPDSLYDLEYDVLCKADQDCMFQEAKDSLRKICFIAAVMDKGVIQNSGNMESRIQKYEKETGQTLKGYERERIGYLLYENDVATYILKIAQIKNDTEASGPQDSESKALVKEDEHAAADDSNILQNTDTDGDTHDK